MKIDVFTLFPSWFDWFASSATSATRSTLGHELEAVDLRATTPLSAGQVDDTPYGGGAGMVIRVDVVEAALEARYAGDPADGERRPRRVVALAAGGRQFDDALASELAAEPELTLLCGRYEGFDERVHEHLATDVVSIGPYVLAGRRAGGDGGLRRRAAQAPRARSATRTARWRSPSADGARGRARSTRTTRGRPSGAGTGSPRCCSRATTAGPRVAPRAEPQARGRGRPGRRPRLSLARLRYH